MDDPMDTLQALERYCLRLAEEPSDDTFDALFAERPHLGRELIDWLRWRFVDGHTDPALARFDGDPLFWELTGLLLTEGNEDLRFRLLDQVVFRVFHPQALRPLSDLVRAVFSAQQAEAVLLERARGDDPEAAHLAHELAYYLFNASEEYPLSEAGRAVFDLG